jgi:outer membrane protein X
MKRILIVGISLLSISMVKAQSSGSASSESIFKPFKVDVSFGGAIPSGSGSKGGVLFAIEPKYAIMDQLAVGLRIEGAVTARGFVASDGSSAQADIKATSSYVATGDYYFSNKSFRPFVGAGVGIFSLAAAKFDEGNGTTTELASSSSKFGGLVRAGFELGHFRLGVEYNLIGNTTISDPGDPSFTIKAKNSYLGLKAGFFFGGGRKK